MSVFEEVFAVLVFGFSIWESVEVAAVTVFFANLVTICLPNKVKDSRLQRLIDFLNLLSMNILRNANRLYRRNVYVSESSASSRRVSPKKRRKRVVPPSVAGGDV